MWGSVTQQSVQGIKTSLSTQFYPSRVNERVSVCGDLSLPPHWNDVVMAKTTEFTMPCTWFFFNVFRYEFQVPFSFELLEL